MRPIFTLLIALAFCLQGNAQLQPGHLYPGFSLGYESSSKLEAAGGRGSVMIALSKRSSLEMFYDYSRTREFLYLNQRHYVGFQRLGISYTYLNFFRNTQRWGWFVTTDLAWLHTKYIQRYHNGKFMRATDYPEFSIRPGIFFRPSGRVLLHADLGGYSLSKYGGKFHSDLKFGRQLNLGIKLSFGDVRRRSRR